MYAEVLLFQKTGIARETLTYEVPDVVVNTKALIGALVQVPLGRSVRMGIIMAIHAHAANFGESGAVVVRPIKNVICMGVIAPGYLAFIRWLSGEFRTPLWKIARHAMPEQIRNGKIALKETTMATIKGVSSLPPMTIATSRTEMVERMRKIIDTTAGTVVILTPEIEIEPWWMTALAQLTEGIMARSVGRPILIMKGTLTPKQRALAWKRVYEEPGLIVVASRSGVYLPTQHIGAYIVMHDWAIGHKEDQEPKFHVAQIAPIVARLAGVPCTILTESPALAAVGAVSAKPAAQAAAAVIAGQAAAAEAAAAVIAGQAAAQKPARVPAAAEVAAAPKPAQPPQLATRRRADTKLQVVDRRLERRAGKERLHELIAQVIEKESRMIIYLNASGEARLMRCNDCGWIPRCTRCSLPYAVESARGATAQSDPQNRGARSTHLTCRRCRATKQIPHHCNACGNVKLRMLGAGIEQVERIIKQKFPSARTALYSSRHAPTTKERKEILKNFAATDATNILITTELLHPDSPIPEVPIVACWDIDNDLHRPHYRAAEDTLHQLQALQMHLKPRGLLLIQTYTPTHPLLTHYENNTLDQWYRDELASRKALNYPPFGEIITLMGDRMALERAYHTLIRTQAAVHRDLQIEEKTKHLKTREKPYLVIRGPRVREHVMRLPINETITVDINSPYTT